MENNFRVRFAPSPTGYLHIGGVRTALFNWLLAKQKKGTFILRIEDTDEARSNEESVGAIINGMNWLGLTWDEGPGKENPKYAPYHQMQRKELGIYQKYIDILLAEGRAYPCYCTQEEVEKMRHDATASKRPPKYNGACSCLSAEQRKEKEAQGRTAVIRFKMPQEGRVEFEDIVRGHMAFENSLLDDFVIMKTNGVPTYNFACVVDDHLMEISHVVRGDDHLSNTPRQVHLFKALGWEEPVFAHLSMILGPDGSRLSKRHGHTSVLEYETEGYLPEAMINYLSLLGWATEDSQNLFKLDELISKFSLERCSKSPATFDPQKLVWMNGEYVRSMAAAELVKRFFAWAEKTPTKDKIAAWDRSLMEKVIIMEHEKIKLLKDVCGLIDFFFSENVEYAPEAVAKVLKTPTALEVLKESAACLANKDDFSAEALEKFTRDLAVEKGLKNGQIFHPLRVSISGRTQGPSLFHMMEAFGRQETLRRINVCIEKLTANPPLI